MIPFAPAPASDAPWHRRFAVAVRHPIRWLDQLTGARTELVRYSEPASLPSSW